jgi:hypothetical protein
MTRRFIEVRAFSNGAWNAAPPPSGRGKPSVSVLPGVGAFPEGVGQNYLWDKYPGEIFPDKPAHTMSCGLTGMTSKTDGGQHKHHHPPPGVGGTGCGPCATPAPLALCAQPCRNCGCPTNPGPANPEGPHVPNGVGPLGVPGHGTAYVAGVGQAETPISPDPGTIDTISPDPGTIDTPPTAGAPTAVAPAAGAPAASSVSTGLLVAGVVAFAAGVGGVMWLAHQKAVGR